ncbi:hypothetical protein PR048_028624 [Dryococelus australis]|uniref:Reverse transcriptase/retrotransposon-derived protein RNase H-like domain-containing protein n=1 Tax=Dryococelus australis TaxID=614101 RepID=A0ABQ9GB59_9NEOP|nr:hypothetical protein PR048_028624 [Dryococelus australis]
MTSTKEELEDITKKVILKLKQAGLKLTVSKCIFNKSSKGISPDPAKVATIEKIRKTYHHTRTAKISWSDELPVKIHTNVSEISTPLRHLLEKNVVWQWEQDQDSAFETLNKCLKFPPVLTYYDNNKPVTLSVDAGSHSVASVLLQENQPIAYVSKALTKARPNRKGSPHLLTACKKFHQYTWGNKNLQIESDHKLLEAIFKKRLLEAPARLQRILFKVLPYNSTLKYVKGSQLYIADALSRDCHNTSEADVPPTFEIHVLFPLSKEWTMELQQAIDSSEELPTLRTTILKDGLQKELAVYKDIIFKGAQTLIPSSMKGLVISHLHHSHKENIVQPAHYYKGILLKKPLRVEDIPSCPWMYVASDLFQLKGKNFLAIADSYSGYFDFTLL